MARQAKEHLPRAELLPEWQEVGRRHGFTSENVYTLMGRQLPRQDLAARVGTCIRAAAERITRQDSHFPERELVRRAAEEAQTMGIPASVLRHMIKQELDRSPEFVGLGRSDGEIRYTTREMLALEKKLLAQVESLKSLPQTPLAETTVRAVEGPLADEQRQALRHLTQSGGSIHLVSGLAGTGKTSMLRAARAAFEREGFEVYGACLSGKAAQGLEEGAGIRSNTLAKLLGMPQVGFRGELDRGPIDTLKDHARQVGRAALGKNTWPVEPIRLTPKAVLVVDEAGMVGTRQMERLTETVLAAGARLVLVGDEKQLQAIDAGGPFGSLGDRLGRATLTEIRRQREPWAREAVKQIAGGEARAALREYASRGLITVTEDRHEAMRALVNRWKRDGAVNPRDHLILASSNAEASRLNQMAQTQRMLAGGLGKQALGIAGSDLHHGDRVLFTRNSKRYGVQNGSLGTVTEVDVANGILTVRLDRGKLVMVPVRDYAHLKLGYALTTHKAQGATTENAYVLLGGPGQDRELSYVQASRARGTTRFFLDKVEAGDDMRDLCKQLEHSRQKNLSHDLLERSGKEQMTSRTVLVRHVGWPNVEGRVALGFGKLETRYGSPLPSRRVEVGVSGLIGQVRTSSTANRIFATTAGVGFDLTANITDRFGLKGEFYKGQAMGSYFGGSGQSVNTDTFRAIRSIGGWGEAFYYLTPKLHTHWGGGIDDPRNQDVGNNQRTQNQFVFGNLIWDATKNLQLGFEVSRYETLWNLPNIPDTHAWIFHTRVALKF